MIYFKTERAIAIYFEREEVGPVCIHAYQRLDIRIELSNEAIEWHGDIASRTKTSYVFKRRPLWPRLGKLATCRMIEKWDTR